jgi:hypothetical protein
MRLGTCIAFEFVVGIGTIAALGYGSVRGVAELRQLVDREASAASLSSRELGVPGVIRPVDRPVRLEPEFARGTQFEGVADEILLAPLRTGLIQRIKFNRGGSSLSLRIDFDNGARAAFKPDQIHLQSVPRREVAAFRVNRMLGLVSVAPAIARQFPREEILAALDPSQRSYISRLQAEMIADSQGNVGGELSWWIPVIGRAKIGGFPIDGVDGIVTWKRMLSIGNDIPERDANLARQISSMVLFDHLINNSDRWTGGNARTSADGVMLYFMDNTLSFGVSREGHERAIIYLKRSQKFSRSLVERLRTLTFVELERAMSRDTGPYEELLTDQEIRTLLSRRDYSLAYIDDLIQQYGTDAVLVFP